MFSAVVKGIQSLEFLAKKKKKISAFVKIRTRVWNGIRVLRLVSSINKCNFLGGYS